MKNKKIKKIFRNPWLITLTATAIISVLVKLFSKFKILTAILKLFINIKNLIFKFFSASISIPLWFFISLLIIGVIFIALILMLLWGEKKSTPNFLNYIEDRFFGIVWRWKWKFDEYDKNYWIDNLFPFCPRCDCQLSSSSPNIFYCPNCDFKSDVYSKSETELKMIIKGRARKIIYQELNELKSELNRYKRISEAKTLKPRLPR